MIRDSEIIYGFEKELIMEEKTDVMKNFHAWLGWRNALERYDSRL